MKSHLHEVLMSSQKVRLAGAALACSAVLVVALVVSLATSRVRALHPQVASASRGDAARLRAENEKLRAQLAEQVSSRRSYLHLLPYNPSRQPKSADPQL